MLWLLEQSVAETMQRMISAGVHPTVEQQIEFEARSFGDDGDGPRLLTTAGSSAEIAISGVITKAPDFLAMLFGGGNTTYADINAAIAAAEQDENVKDITFTIDSPGGHFEGLFDTLAAVQAAKKPTKAIAVNVAASAAFAIGTQADEFVAANRATRLGSVGVVVGIRVDDTVVEIASTEAPKKRPDVTTEEGKAIVREQIDAMHEIFAEAIAEGRGTTVEKVNAEFGQGATLLAEEATKRGMIDGMAGSPLKAVQNPAAASRETTQEQGGKIMDLGKLKAEHPDVYAAAVQQGVTQERDRVSAHLVMGEASGDMKTACSSIKDGSGMTATLQSTYMAAGMNRQDTNNRSDDDASASSAADGADSDDNLDAKATEADTVATELGTLLGVGEG